MAVSKPAESAASILIASDSTTTATLIKKLLDDEFEHVRVSTHPDAAAEDFDSQRPEVLVLAFGTLEKSERHNLGLYRQSKEIHRQPHRSIILCHKDEVRRAYDLCRDEIFDDYILFWPVAHDAQRLPMAVHHALREIAVTKESGAGPKVFATQLRSLAELETLLKQGMAEGDEGLDLTARLIAQANQDIRSAITGFSQRMLQGELSGLVEVRNAKALEQAFDRLKQESIEAPLHAVAESVQPLKRLAAEFRQASAPHLESMRALQASAGGSQPTLMVVDDDEFQHKILSRLLKDAGFRLVFASSGIEALNLLRKIQPDLVLMDFSMPDMDGLEVTRRIKGVAHLAHIPIIMITGNSEEHVVTDSLTAGAIDFMVKPLGVEALTEKIAKVLGTIGPSSVEPIPDLSQSDL